MVIGHTLQALVHHNHRNIKHKAEAFSEFLDARLALSRPRGQDPQLSQYVYTK